MNNIELTFYTTDQSAFNTPPEQLSRAKAQWWHDTPLTHTIPYVYADLPKATIKTCDGYNQFHSNGFTISFPEDITFTIGETYKDGIECSLNEDQIEVHHHAQRGYWLPPEKYQHVKILYPWFIECKEDVKFAFIGNTWVLDDPECFIIPPAVVDYKTQYAGHINVFIPYIGVKRTFTIKAGTPIVAAIPLSERKLQIITKLIDKEQLNELINNSEHQAITIKKNVKRLEKHFGCPFHELIGIIKK